MNFCLFDTHIYIRLYMLVYMYGVCLQFCVDIHVWMCLRTHKEVRGKPSRISSHLSAIRECCFLINVLQYLVLEILYVLLSQALMFWWGCIRLIDYWMTDYDFSVGSEASTSGSGSYDKQSHPMSLLSSSMPLVFTILSIVHLNN